VESFLCTLCFFNSLCIFSRSSASSGYLNPVLNFGIAMASGQWTKHYVYWVGTALGGIIATLLHGLVFASDDQLWIAPRGFIPERIA
jgi:glycerol uptake facilitator-like aquaporin